MQAAKQLTEAEWHSLRKNGIGASESPAVLGEHPYLSRIELWAHKTEKLPDDEFENEAMEWGHELEPIIARKAAKRLGVDIFDEGRFNLVVHPNVPYLFATIDRRAESPKFDGPGAVECKNTSAYLSKAWQDSGPLHAQIQLQTQLEVRVWNWGVLAGLVGGNSLAAHLADRDKEMGEIIVNEVGEFWDQHVMKDIPPEPDASESARRTLHKLHAEDRGTTVMLPAESLKWVEQRKVGKALIQTGEEKVDEAENQLKAIMGDATWAKIPGGGRLQWKIVVRNYKPREASTSQSRVFHVLKT